MEKDDGQLLSKSIEGNGMGWEPYRLTAEGDRDKNRMTTRMNLAGVCTLSRRLMAIERARMLGRKPVDIGALALELEARRWAGGRARSEQATKMRRA